MHVTLFVTYLLPDMLKVVGLSYILIQQKHLQMLGFVHNFTDTHLACSRVGSRHVQPWILTSTLEKLCAVL